MLQVPLSVEEESELSRAFDHDGTGVSYKEFLAMLEDGRIADAAPAEERDHDRYSAPSPRYRGDPVPEYITLEVARKVEAGTCRLSLLVLP